jgi:hypothetical protein
MGRALARGSFIGGFAAFEPADPGKRGPMTYSDEKQNSVNPGARKPDGRAVRIVAAGTNEVLSAVPLTNTRLPSLDTPHVLDWLALHKDSPIFVIPEAQTDLPVPARLEGRPSLVVRVESQEYESVVGLLPR